jgi:hypothetical protein
MSAVKPRKVSPEAWRASRFVRLETGSSSEAELASRVGVRSRWQAQGDRGGDDRRGQQNHGRVQVEHGGAQGGRGEDQHEQPSGVPARSPTQHRGEPAKDPQGIGEVGEHEDGGEETHGGPQRLHLLQRG